MASTNVRTAITPAEEEAIIKSRFLTGDSTAGAVRAGRAPPSLNKVAKGFLQLAAETQSGSEAKSAELLTVLQREIGLMELQNMKLRLTCEANTREQQGYQKKQKRLEEDIDQAKLSIEAKKRELQEAKVERQNNEKFEVLRGVAMQTPSRPTTTDQIAHVRGSIVKWEQLGKQHTLTLEKRRRDFALLFHVLEELKRTADVDDDGGAAAATAADGAAAGRGAATREAEAMQH